MDGFGSLVFRVGPKRSRKRQYQLPLRQKLNEPKWKGSCYGPHTYYPAGDAKDEGVERGESIELGVNIMTALRKQ